MNGKMLGRAAWRGTGYGACRCCGSYRGRRWQRKREQSQWRRDLRREQAS